MIIEAGADKTRAATVDSYNGEAFAVISNAPVIFNTMSLTLDGAIGVNFFVKVTDESVLGEEAYMEMSLRDGTSKKVMLSDDVYDSQKGKYKFTFYVNSLQMAEEINRLL